MRTDSGDLRVGVKIVSYFGHRKLGRIGEFGEFEFGFEN